MQLPCDHLKAELARLSCVHGRSVGDGEIEATWRSGLLCLAVTFADGMTWEVPFDPEAQDIVQGANATKH